MDHFWFPCGEICGGRTDASFAGIMAFSDTSSALALVIVAVSYVRAYPLSPGILNEADAREPPRLLDDEADAPEPCDSWNGDTYITWGNDKPLGT